VLSKKVHLLVFYPLLTYKFNSLLAGISNTKALCYKYNLLLSETYTTNTKALYYKLVSCIFSLLKIYLNDLPNPKFSSGHHPMRFPHKNSVSMPCFLPASYISSLL